MGIFKPKEEKEAEGTIKEIVVPTPRPFLEPEEPITSLETFFKRVKQLKNGIEYSKSSIKDIEESIAALNNPDTEWRMERNGYGGECFYFHSTDNREIDQKVRKMITEHWNSRLAYYKDLIHTCEDELDWLESKMTTGPSFQNRFESGSFNFDPNKDHV